MKSTRQFTKRRPQSPLTQQATTTNASSTLAPMSSATAVTVQSSAPLRASTNTTHAKEPSHEHQEVSQHATTYQANPYMPNQSQEQYTAAHDHSHDHPHVHSHQHHHDHVHDHHQHDIHEHKHDHDHHHHHDHDHHHHHHYPAVSIPPFPSWSDIFAQLAPMQKTIFTWFLIHGGIGILVWWVGASRDSLAIMGLSYLVIFDALGVLNTFVSDIARTHPAFLASSTKRPYSARRYEIVFAMATTIYLLFVTMYTTKESLEHLLTEDANHHDQEHHKSLGFIGFIILCISMGATIISCVNLRNHDNLVRHLRRSPPTVHGFSYNVINGARGNAINIVLSNIYTTSILASCLVVLVFFVLGFASPVTDKFLAFGESVIMLYLGGPTALALMKLLLQTTPDVARSGIESRLFEIRQNPDVVAIDRVHFWQNTYGKCVGTIEVQVKPTADEESILQFVYQKLEGLTTADAADVDNHSSYSKSELTVSIIKQ
ncbi:hypothetical protein LRAMOSA09391 [Lichtheimia ramosa]|uniref:Cation efflux protein transmembrane domain-containing protein n=1 Tax=Lichtheimia ramosa TaxID=688394 RepID=A0A077WGT2_9FUNG|nr:hypothetical protein LRAMOSA09391 [Lichtheimia ramosa]